MGHGQAVGAVGTPYKFPGLEVGVGAGRTRTERKGGRGVSGLVAAPHSPTGGAGIQHERCMASQGDVGAWPGVAWPGVAWCGLAEPGAAWIRRIARWSEGLCIFMKIGGAQCTRRNQRVTVSGEGAAAG